MAKRQLPKRRFPVSPRSVISLMVAVIIAFLFLFSVIGLFRKYITLRREIADLRAQHATLQEKEQQLREKNTFLETSEGQEQLLRNKFNLVRPGESVVVISPNKKAIVPEVRHSAARRFWDSVVEFLGL